MDILVCDNMKIFHWNHTSLKKDTTVLKICTPCLQFKKQGIQILNTVVDDFNFITSPYK